MHFFHLGDVIAVAGLLRKTCVALKHHGGAASEYKATVAQLDRLQAITESVLSLKIPSQTEDESIQSFLKALQVEASSCVKTIKGFVEKVKKYEPRLGSQAPSDFKGIWSKGKMGKLFLGRTGWHPTSDCYSSRHASESMPSS